MTQIAYNRELAVAYAHKWAFERNPRYHDFGGRPGGDCANFASQCIFEGIGVMNYDPLCGWYHKSPDDRSPSWSGVRFLYDFLTGNKAHGPCAAETGPGAVLPGDIIQIAAWMPDYHHTLIVVESSGSPESILVAAHSYDSDYRSLQSYNIKRIRFLHILGGRKD